MNYEELKTKIESSLDGVKLKVVRESLLIENTEDLPKVAGFLKESADYSLDFLSSLTASDFITFLETTYHLYSIEKKSECVQLRVRCERENPHVPSLVNIYRGAEFQEREAYDMYGIIYDGHPDPRRLFMWDNFEGFPMRKDYVQEDSETLETADIEWLEKNNIKVSEEAKQKAEELKASGKRATAESEGKEK